MATTRRASKRVAKSEPATSAPAPAFAAVIAALEKSEGVELGRLFASVGLKVDGKVFAMHVKGSLVVKLPKERVDALVEAGAGVYFDPGHGRLMKEWISLNGGEKTWIGLAREARDSVRTVRR